MSIGKSRSEESQWDEELTAAAADPNHPATTTHSNVPQTQGSSFDSTRWILDSMASPPLGPSDEQSTFLVTAAGTSYLDPALEAHSPLTVSSSPMSVPTTSTNNSPSRRFTQWKERRNQEKLMEQQARAAKKSQQQKQQRSSEEPLETPYHAASPTNMTNSKQRTHNPFLGESLYERLQSRAQPDAVLEDRATTASTTNEDHDAALNTTNATASTETSLQSQHHQLDSDDCALLSRTALAQKRVKVLQLLILGWLGLVFGWLATFFSGTLCSFATTSYNNNYQLQLSLGLWKYSPVDSVVMGSDVCVGYSSLSNQNAYDDTDDAPRLARLLNIAALSLGTLSLVVVWLYLIVGWFRARQWLYGIWASWLAATCQLASVISFYTLTSACHSNSVCHLGSGASLALVSTLAWAVFGMEMLYNTPGPVIVPSASPCGASLYNDTTDDCDHKAYAMTREEDGLMRDTSDNQVVVGMSSLELSDLKKASKEYMERFHNSRGSYCPPDIDAVRGEVV